MLLYFIEKFLYFQYIHCIEFLLFGWTLQLIMGTAFWILPRFAQEPKRGNETFVGVAFGLLNVGLALVKAIVVV